LSFLQVANYIFPLITLPYLVRVLKPEKYGLIAFANSFISYFMILTDYGFHLSAPREISINRDNKQKLAEIFSSVMVIKFFLMFLSLIIMTGIVFLFEKFRRDWLLYYLTFGMVLGHVMFPTWFFQGIENMKFITLLNLIAKILFTISIFIFVKKQTDYFFVPLLNSLGFIVAGVIALVMIKNLGVRFILPNIQQIIHHLKEGWHIFVSTVAISLYTISNTFILGLFTNNTIVGYYAAAEKLVRTVQNLLTPVSQSVYPHISKIAKESKEAGIRFIRKLTVLVSLFTFIVSVIIFIFADLIIKIILGNQYLESVIVLRILAFFPFIIGLSNVFGIQTMLPLNYKNAFSNILIFASIINICIALIMVPLYKHVGISISVVITEIFVTLTMFIYLQKKGIKIISRNKTV
ncbi:MAG: flippase, partial [Endomicrobia bacterium]|nr:flippase [Endomicrobiia bacterium]